MRDSTGHPTRPKTADTCEATRQYFERLDAPEGKKLVVFEESAHTPFMAEPESFNQALFAMKEAGVSVSNE